MRMFTLYVVHFFFFFVILASFFFSAFVVRRFLFNNVVVQPFLLLYSVFVELVGFFVTSQAHVLRTQLNLLCKLSEACSMEQQCILQGQGKLYLAER